MIFDHIKAKAEIFHHWKGSKKTKLVQIHTKYLKVTKIFNKTSVIINCVIHNNVHIHVPMYSPNLPTD